MTTDQTTLEGAFEDGVLPHPAIGERVLWDHRVRGLGLRLRAKSPTTWIVRRRIDGRLVKRTLGRLEEKSLEQARAAAETLLAVPIATASTPLVSAFAETFLRDCAGRWKPATRRNYRHDLERHVIPVLGAKRIDALTRADVVSWLGQLDVAPGSRERILSVFSSMMRHAELLGLRPPSSNPCAGLRRHRAEFKAHYLSGEEFRHLGWALDHLAPSHPVEVTLIRFLMLTGVRKSEAFVLEWSMIQGDRAVLPDSKTGSKTIWLAAPVRRLLAGLVRSNISPRVFTLPNGRGMPHALHCVWRRGRNLARLSGLRLHDLRHSYASVAVTTGEELRTVSGLLGHTQVATTMGYAHLAEAPVIAAAGRVCGQLAEALTPHEPVAPIQPRPPGPRARRSARPKPAEPTLDSLSDAERLWEPHIQAFRKGRLKLTDFCKERGLDPQEMRPFLAKHYHRAKGAAS